MKAVIKWAAVAVLAAAASPILFMAGYGVWHGRDVINGLRMLFVEPTGNTIDASLIEYYEPVAVRSVGVLANPELHENSGLASSVKTANLLWAINDSGNASELFAIDATGEHLGKWRLDIPQPADFESLAAFEWQGEAFLMIADVGDNYRWRRQLSLFVIREPGLDTPVDQVIEVEWTIRFRYPDVHRDCEAVAVDAARGEVLLITKRVIPAEVYSVPLAPDNTVQTAKLIAELDKLPQFPKPDPGARSWPGAHQSQPTGLDIIGNRAVVVTNKDAYLFDKHDGESWARGFSGYPKRIVLPWVGQREAVAFARDGARFYTSSERSRRNRSSAIYEVEL